MKWWDRMMSFQPTFLLSSFPSSRGFLVPLHFSLRVVSPAYLRLLIFLLAILIPACASSSPAFRMMYSAYKLSKQGDNIQPWHTSFPIWNQSIFMSSSNCWFLTRIQVFQESGKVVWYSHLFQNFPQFVEIQTIKGFGVVSKAEVDVFLKLSCFYYDPSDVGSLISGFSFLNPAWTSGSSQFTYCWSLAWRILSITLLAC